ncbi:MAG: hypothetical protein M3Z24_08260, partial [Chloroflexota bacterium]|nr:hypothetical protein [Chloroflexota bacterium]
VNPSSSAGVFFFRLYYMLGAALMPAWLGLGSVALVMDKRFTRVMLMILLTLSIFAIVFLFQAVVDIQKLSQVVGSAGAGVFHPAEWLGTIIILNTLGVVEVVAVAIYSGWQVLRRQSSPHLLWANILILAGDLINAAAGSSARLGLGLAFWLVMAVGWSVFFVGVVLASQRRSLPILARAKTSAVSLQGQPVPEK